jgi:hypothetical protein
MGKTTCTLTLCPNFGEYYIVLLGFDDFFVIDAPAGANRTEFHAAAIAQVEMMFDLGTTGDFDRDYCYRLTGVDSTVEIFRPEIRHTASFANVASTLSGMFNCEVFNLK